MTISPETLAELERLDTLATQGPWSHGRTVPGYPRFIIGECLGWNLYPATNEVTHGTRAEDDAALIVALRNAAPALLATCRQAEELRALVKRMLPWCHDTELEAEASRLGCAEEGK